MQSVPRPPASVPLGGSLRASRAAQLARPEGPLAAVDLADGRGLLVQPLGSAWVAVDDGEVTLALPACESPEAECVAPASARRLGTAVALAAALGAAAVALATGFSGAPSPAVAGSTGRPSVPWSPSPPALIAKPRGGRAVPPPRLPKAVAPVPPKAVAAPAVRAPAPAAPPPVAAPAPPPPPLPQLPSAPAL